MWWGSVERNKIYLWGASKKLDLKGGCQDFPYFDHKSSWYWWETIKKIFLESKKSQKIQLKNSRIEISLRLGVPDNQISIHFGVPDNQISLRFEVPNNQISLLWGSPTTSHLTYPPSQALAN